MVVEGSHSTCSCVREPGFGIYTDCLCGCGLRHVEGYIPMDTPITETSNHITQNIDVADALGIVTLLQKCDVEIFEGWEDYEGLYHPSALQKIERITEIASSILESPESCAIVISGCGTSGRLAFLTTRTFNQKLSLIGKPACFSYLIAGRDKALFTSQEAPEDDPSCGIEMLREVCCNKKRVLFVGVTCGLSAPFVAGQLHYCMQNLDWITPVVMGFNPVRLARNLPIENWNRTFLQVIQQLEHIATQGKGFVLNPVVGPEPITGSSRMKSGTATKILLEAMFVPAFLKSLQQTWVTKNHIDTYRLTYESVIKQRETISSVVRLAGVSLNSGCSIYYIGWDSLGVMGLIDASECPPTFGSTLDDVRGFIDGGYSLLLNSDGDLSSLGKHFKISLESLEDDILPFLTPSDLVVFCHNTGQIKLSQKMSASKCKKCLLTFSDAELGNKLFDTVVHVPLSDEIKNIIGDNAWLECQQLYCEVAVKWICNAITTGAHILKGKIYQNMMVDLKVSNNKLFHRAVGLIQRYSNLSKEDSQRYLLQSIYMKDTLTQKQLEAPVSKHIDVATPVSKVVPCALLAAILQCPVQDSKSILESQPVIRNAISDSLHKLIR